MIYLCTKQQTKIDMACIPITKQKKFLILNKTHGRCAYCGRKLTLETMTLDHIFPKSKRKNNDYTNLFASCRQCNNLKGDRTIKQYRSLVSKIIQTYGNGRPVKFYYEKNDLSSKEESMKRYGKELARNKKQTSKTYSVDTFIKTFIEGFKI